MDVYPYNEVLCSIENWPPLPHSISVVKRNNWQHVFLFISRLKRFKSKAPFKLLTNYDFQH